MGFWSYLLSQWKAFKGSFLHFRLIHVALIEVLFLVAVILSIIFLGPIVLQDYATMSGATGVFNQLEDMDPSLALVQVQQIRQSMIEFFWVLILWALGLVASYGIAKAGQWLLITGRKTSIGFFLRFIGYTAIFITGFLLWSAITIAMFKEDVYPAFFLVVSLPLAVYLNFLFQPSIASTGRLWQGLKLGLKTAFTRIHHFILPWTAILTIFGVINSAFLAVYNRTESRIAVITYIVLLVFFIAWYKFYAHDLLAAYGRKASK
jgi:hypothetical protein